MANTTWKQVVYDVADGIRTLLGTSSTIPVGDLKGKLTGITRKSAATYTPSTSAQTIAAGQYLAGAQTIEAMPSGALSDVSISSSGLITQQVGTSGYLASGTKKTKQLTTQAAKTITPGSSSQTAAASGVYTTGAVTVSAVSTETKTVTPSSSVQTITPSSGKYFSSITVNPADMSSVNVTNGTIAKYCSGSETINPGTFVELGEYNYSQNTDYTDSDRDEYPLYGIIPTSTNKFIGLYKSSSIIYGAVSTIDDDLSITRGEFQEVLSTSYFTSCDWVKLDDNKFIIGYTYSSYPYACVITIDDNDTITAGTAVKLGSTVASSMNIELSSSGDILVFTTDTTAYLYTGRITISGTTITVTSALTQQVDLASYAGSGDSITYERVIKLNDNTYIASFVDDDSSSTQYYYAVPIIYSNDTYTLGTALQLGSNSYASSIDSVLKCITINDTIFGLVLSNKTNSKMATYSVNNNVITLSSSIALQALSESTIYYPASEYAIIFLQPNILITAYITSTSGYGYYILEFFRVSSDGTLSNIMYTKPYGTVSDFINYNDLSLLLTSENLLVCPIDYYTTSNNERYIAVIGYSDVINQSSSCIYGITRTTCTTETAGEVWILNGGGESDLKSGLISFTVSGTTYQAESGMTLEEWVNSEYNTCGATLKTYSELSYVFIGEAAISDSNYSSVVATTVITDGASFNLD